MCVAIRKIGCIRQHVGILGGVGSPLSRFFPSLLLSVLPSGCLLRYWLFLFLFFSEDKQEDKIKIKKKKKEKVHIETPLL